MGLLDSAKAAAAMSSRSLKKSLASLRVSGSSDSQNQSNRSGKADSKRPSGSFDFEQQTFGDQQRDSEPSDAELGDAEQGSSGSTLGGAQRSSASLDQKGGRRSSTSRNMTDSAWSGSEAAAVGRNSGVSGASLAAPQTPGAPGHANFRVGSLQSLPDGDDASRASSDSRRRSVQRAGAPGQALADDSARQSTEGAAAERAQQGGCGGEAAAAADCPPAGGGPPPEPAASARQVAAARSSFALERQSLEANRASLKKLGGSYRFSLSDDNTQLPADEGELCRTYGIPELLRGSYLRLAAVPLNTPVPLTMLARLWASTDLDGAEGTAVLLEARGVMHLARINNGDVWCLVAPPHLRALHHVCKDKAAPVHAALLASYKAEAGADSCAALPDDGYILSNVGWHLVGTGQVPELKALLLCPPWLEAKLCSYGAGAVVADFRRALMAGRDPDLKLVLDAFTMSCAAATRLPRGCGALGVQMAGRLMAVRQSEFVKAWCAAQLRYAADTAAAGASLEPLPLWPRTASLEQAGGLQRMTLRGHQAGVVRVLLAPSGVEVITASKDGTLRVWDLEIGDCVLVLEGHTGAITAADVSATGDFLLSGSADLTARLWELERGRVVRVLEGHLGAITGAALDPHARFAVTASSDGTGRVWELAGGSCVHLLRGGGTGGVSRMPDGWLRCVALAPDGRSCVTGGDDCAGRVWDLTKGSCARTLTGHKGWVVDAVVSRDACKAATASHDGTAIIWDLWSGAQEAVLTGHTGRVNRVRMSADGQRIATTSDDATCRLYDTRSGELKASLEGHTAWVNDVALSDGGALAVTASADALAIAWDLQRGGQPLRTLRGHAGDVTSAVLTKKGRFVVTGSEDGTARVWDLHAPDKPPVETHRGRVHVVRTTPDGRRALTAGEDGDVRVWCAATGAPLACMAAGNGGGAVRWLEVSADGRYAVAAQANRAVAVWDLQEYTLHSQLPPQQGSRIKSFCITPDGARALVGAWDSSVQLVDLSSGQVVRKIQDRSVGGAASHCGGVNACYLSPDGAVVATVAKDATTRLWDAQTGQPLAVLNGHSDAVAAAAYSASGTTLATVSYDRTCRVWENSLSGGRCTAVLQHDGPPRAVALATDGRAAATAVGERAYLWDTGSGLLVDVLQAHGEPITGLAFSQDGRLLATCSADGGVALWSGTHGLQVGTFMGDAPATGVAFGGDGDAMSVVVATDTGRVHFLNPQP